jgi:hypothetical protein
MGTYRDNSTNKCKRVPEGFYSHSNFLLFNCTKKLLERLFPSVALPSRKRDCFYVIIGSPNCVFCDIEKFTNMSGMESCLQCPKRRWTEVIGATVCSICASGYFSEANSPNCLDCELGNSHKITTPARVPFVALQRF